MHTVRRSLQTPDPDEPYLIEGPNATEMKDMINQAISSGNYYKLYNEAIEILKAWEHTDDVNRIKQAAFSCKILKVTWPYYKLVNRGFLNAKIKALNTLREKLLRGIDPEVKEREFIMAICGGLYDEWLEAIRWQAERATRITLQ
ncbi:hypothetical protein H9Q72_014494 [Fusarium xylarioides]|uniref:Uncharacterized protein n=1 Tax=Fusarium xylarioides TaxID=221167 RepID=A0A9P7L130_9HYPO|nr:hypothetical protein H9Q72_014494 [Fusarium xylarioides]